MRPTTHAADAYARRAQEYAERLGSMAAVHDSDRQLVDTWTSTVRGPVLDAGCGPGHWTSYLAERGLDARGLDLVPAFVERARSTYPGVPFELGSIDAIDHPDASFEAVLSWYSTIHHHPTQISRPLAEFSRVLRPGGVLVLGYFDGPTIEEFDHAVTPAFRWPASELRDVLERVGLEVVETHTRTGRGYRPHGAIVSRRLP